MSRIDRFREKLDKLGIDVYLETYLPNIRYLTGFSGSNAFLFIGKDFSLFVSDPRYEEQSKEEVEGADIFIYRKDLFECKSSLPDSKLKLGVPADYIKCSLYNKIKENLEMFDVVLLDDPVKELRKTKTEEEISLIRESQTITDKIFEDILKIVKPGEMTELDLAAEIEYRMKKFGAEKPSFDTIVATGPHSALPHAKPRNVKINQETPLLMDFGNYYKGYSSDMTRTVWIGENPPEKFIEIYQVVLEAQERAENEARPGMTGKEIDNLAREVIEKAGYGKYFGHSLGHGVGLEVHEYPRLSFLGNDTIKLGMVFTVEPGIYLPGLFGVRIEDIVVMRENGVEKLTESPKNLIKIF